MELVDDEKLVRRRVWFIYLLRLSIAPVALCKCYAEPHLRQTFLLLPFARTDPKGYW
jgi:hypothetical protein